MGVFAIEAPTISVQSATNCNSRSLFHPFLSELAALFLSISLKSAANYVFINVDLPDLEYPGPSMLYSMALNKMLLNLYLNAIFDGVLQSSCLE